ncbi:MAG: peptide-methionine (R)-S-oxide reductase MsrB [Thermoplasmatota archaeon]
MEPYDRLDEEDWERKLPPDRFRVLRKKGTEPPFSGELLEKEEDGLYVCGGCGQELFSSDSRFNSGSGWPSFFDAISEDRIRKEADRSHGMVRTEITCSRCGGHLGHVFDDGPEPTGLRYCVNSLSLDFRKDQGSG